MSSVEKPGIGEQIYSGAAELGMFRVTLGLVFGIIFGVAAISFGLYMALLKKNVQVHATIREVIGTCSPIVDRNNLQVKCSVKIEYTYNDISYKPDTIFYTIDGIKVVGQPMTIYIDPNNPSDCSTDSLQKVGWFIFGVGIVIIGFSLLYWWLARRYKFFAAAEGVGMGVGIVSGYGKW